MNSDYDELLAKQKELDQKRIDKAIVIASEYARVESEGLRLLHKTEMQWLEAQQQSRRVNELYRKFFGKST